MNSNDILEKLEGSQPEFVRMTEPSSQEITFNAEETREAARTELDFLAALCMPAVFKYLFPITFKAIWAWLCEYIHRPRDFSQLAIGLPRGFGKTMLMKIFVIYCILFTEKKFILIICGTATKAENIIADIMMMLDEPNVRKVFGNWRVGMTMNRQDMKMFGFRGRNIILAGAGTGSDIRGITRNNERPDLMVFDDIQTKEDSESEDVSNKIETWMIGTAMKAKSPEGCLYVFIANMYPTKNSLLRRLKANRMWTKFIAGGILKDGTSLWEDLQPIEQLLNEYENDLLMGRPEIFFSEVLNDENATVNHLIDVNKLPVYPYTPHDLYNGDFIVIDPASDKKDSDEVSIGYFRLYGNIPALMEVDEGRYSPGETITRTIKMGIRTGARFVVAESNAYQYSLLYWFGFICNLHGIEGFIFEPVYSGSTNKTIRILNMFKSLKAKEQYYHPDTAVHVNAQITSFNALRRDNTDGILDLLTYGPKVVELYGPIIMGMAIIESMEHSAVAPWGELENACF